MMKKLMGITAIAIVLASCKGKEEEKGFEVSGKITNNSAGMIYLAQLPVAATRGIVVDSVKIGSDGKYTLHADADESSIYTLRLDQSEYPFASVINDVKKVTLDVTFPKGEKQFPEKYEVKGSAASSQMKDFMFAFNAQLQDIFYHDQLTDSLKKSNAKDSAIVAAQNTKLKIAENAKMLVDTSLRKAADNPALAMFILGYYQEMARIPNYGLTALNLDEVKNVINPLTAKFPSHARLKGVYDQLNAPEPEVPKKWIGKQSPEITLPDPNGKMISLSSFRGKYVLVDFWASWCGPCRNENPNVVKAFNKFKDKNFAILGVSLDRPGQKDKWLAAIMQDKLTWTHVSDLLEWQSPVVTTFDFGLEGIPYNILVDPSGKIIAERLTGPELEAKLADVLK